MFSVCRTSSLSPSLVWSKHTQESDGWLLIVYVRKKKEMFWTSANTCMHGFDRRKMQWMSWSIRSTFPSAIYCRAFNSIDSFHFFRSNSLHFSLSLFLSHRPKRNHWQNTFFPSSHQLSKSIFNSSLTTHISTKEKSLITYSNVSFSRIYLRVVLTCFICSSAQ